MLMRLREEHGFSLITAVLISVVVFILSLVTIGLSMHNTSQSGRNRERVNAIAAAEAGINYQFSRIQAGSFATGCQEEQTLQSFPRSSFETTITLTDKFGSPLPCGPTTPPPNGAQARIVSEGKATGADPTRKMEALVELERAAGGIFGEGAIFGEGDILIDSNPQIGAPADIQADVYSNGNIELKSNPQIQGSVIAQKCINLDSTAWVKIDVWAKGGTPCTWSPYTVTMQSKTRVVRNVTATTGRIKFNFSSGGGVSGDADAGGDIETWVGVGNVNPDYPKVDGTARRNQTGLQAPGVKTFPDFTYNPSDWTGVEPPYVIENYSTCAAAKTAIGTNNTVKRVVRITSNCELKWDSSEIITLSQDLAIITDGYVFLGGNTRFVSSAPDAKRTLHFMVGRGTSAPSFCFQMQSNAHIESAQQTFGSGNGGIVTLVHARKFASEPTKCKVFLDSTTDIAKGQIFGGGPVDLKSNTKMAYEPVITPGAPITGFKESIIYIREISPNQP